MRFLLRLLQLIYFFYASLLFLVMMIPVVLFSALVAPLGAVRGGNLIYKACRLWGDIWFPMVGIFHKNLGLDAAAEKKEYIYIANHISWLDAALVQQVFRQPLRPLGKAETGKIPLFGFIYRKVVVLVDRTSAKARHRSVLRLKSVLRKGISILVFPEGTFNETHEPTAHFYDGAFKVAIETNTPIKPVVILDSYARMPYDKTFSLNPGKSRAVFLEEISVDGLFIEDLDLLRELAKGKMEAALREYGADWIR
ncbi:MAG: lysophospholipid acyltransferase family protein [Chitinophagaceae bacterium]